MREWTNGKLTVVETEYGFDVYHDDEAIGPIVVSSEDDKNDCIEALDISGAYICIGWDDGTGVEVSVKRDSEFYLSNHRRLCND